MADGAAGSGGSDDWCTVESDPGVFTEMLETVGVKGVQLEELWSLDDDSLGALCNSTHNVFGLIFLFKWLGNDNDKESNSSGSNRGTVGDSRLSDAGATTTNKREPLSEEETPEELFFAHQVTTNACATQAILSILLNAPIDSQLLDSRVDLGPKLTEFKAFTGTFPPSLKGVAISSSEEIKSAHNAYSRQDAFLQEGKLHIPTGDEEAFHFVAYVPVKGVVYELDGLQKGPIVVGTVDSVESPDSVIPEWISVARAAIQERMAAGGDHVKFNLMAVIQDKRLKWREQLEKYSDSESAEYAELVAALAAEDAKREEWKLENQRRRHNYVPLCMQLLTELARLGQLPQLIQSAKERHAAHRQKLAAARKEKS